VEKVHCLSISLWPRPESSSSFDLEAISAQFAEEQLERELSQNLWSLSTGKRVFDLTVATAIALPLLPLLGAIAIAVRIDSKGPALFRQTRVGRNQVPFVIYKFRTMRTQIKSEGPLVTRRDDCRTTKTGLWLRRFKLDELPQLFNVILGDMSLVGPRPKLIGHEKMDMICRPGITGAATLKFAKEEDLLMEIAEHEVETFTIEVLNPIKAGLDTQYAFDGNFRSDMKLLARTAFGLGRHEAISTLPQLIEVSDLVGLTRPQSR
jgi:lipopolysaccharide/colanic/teichoic acid biosynthesis glycosyltransferase